MAKKKKETVAEVVETEVKETVAEVVKYQSTHNGLFFLGGDFCFKAGEVKELSKEQIDCPKTQHAISTGMLVEAK